MAAASRDALRVTKPAGRVYINGRFLTQRITGVQRYAREILSELDTLLAEGGPGSDVEWKLVAPRGTPLPRLECVTGVHRGWLSGHAWEQFDLPRITRDGLLVSFGSTGPCFKARQVITVHDASVYRVPEAFSWKFRAWHRLVVGQIVQRAPRTLAVSEFAAREAVTFFGARPHRIDVTAEGWQHLLRVPDDDSLLEDYGLAPQSYVLAVSSPTPNKNFSLVVDAMAKLRDLPIRFVVAGAVDSRVLVSEQTAADDHVTRVGYVSDGQLKSLYANALCFVFPSRYEGFGIPALEAMALGCPVTTSSIEAAREVCGDAAHYFDPTDAAALERILRGLFCSRHERAAMSERGLRRAAGFSWSTSARKSLETILACLHAEE
jgi:glycosyltransferase involved in cell wall biosynthesis